jgi:hypothetical protein
MESKWTKGKHGHAPIIAPGAVDLWRIRSRKPATVRVVANLTMITKFKLGERNKRNVMQVSRCLVTLSPAQIRNALTPPSTPITAHFVRLTARLTFFQIGIG